jgi:hypothetical protein
MTAAHHHAGPSLPGPPNPRATALKTLQWALVMGAAACGYGFFFGVAMRGDTWSFASVAALLWSSLGLAGAGLAVGSSRSARACALIVMGVVVWIWLAGWWGPVQRLTGWLGQTLHAAFMG